MTDSDGFRSWIGPPFPCNLQDLRGVKNSLGGRGEDAHSLFAPPTSGLNTTDKLKTGKLGTLQRITQSKCL